MSVSIKNTSMLILWSSALLSNFEGSIAGDDSKKALVASSKVARYQRDASMVLMLITWLALVIVLCSHIGKDWNIKALKDASISIAAVGGALTLLFIALFYHRVKVLKAQS